MRTAVGRTPWFSKCCAISSTIFLFFLNNDICGLLLQMTIKNRAIPDLDIARILYKVIVDDKDLEAVAEVLTELLSELLLPVADLLHAAEEEAEYLWLLGPLKTTDEIAVIPEPLNTVSTVLDL